MSASIPHSSGRDPRAPKGADGDGEFERIARYLAPLAASEALGLTDDAALLGAEPGFDSVVTVDAMIAGVHFLNDDPPELIARKLLRVNLSDLAAMGADPRGHLLVTATTDREDAAWFARFASGLAEDQQRYGSALFGGDSVRTPGPLTLSLTAIGRVPGGQAIRRSGARPGDRLWVSGTIGDGALGLRARLGQLPPLSDSDRSFLVDRYRLPEPRLALGRALRGIATAMMDVSDGLVADARHLATTSGIALSLGSDRVPLSNAATAVMAEAPDLLALCLTGGDDYELLFTAPGNQDDAVRSAAAAAGTAVTSIGQAGDASDGLATVTVFDRDRRVLDLGAGGWRHF